MKLYLFILLLFLPLSSSLGQSKSQDEAKIIQVIEEAYVKGVFVNQDSVAVKQGFHPDFVLSVKQDESVLVVTLDQWLEHLELDGTETDDKVEHHFDHISMIGESAAVQMRIFINDQHVYTDFLGLHYFSEGWKIVNKIFQSHD